MAALYLELSGGHVLGMGHNAEGRADVWTATGQPHGRLAMDGNTLTPYPHLSWFAYGLTVEPPRVFVLHEYKAVTHRLIVTERGDADFMWTTGEVHVASHVTSGSIGFFPCDNAQHTLGITAVGGYRGHELLLPSKHLENVCEAEGTRKTTDFAFLPVFHDTHLLSCLDRLLAGGVHGQLAEDIGTEIAARQVIIRLAEISGGRPPEWLRDTSVFASPVMARIVERVDALLDTRTSLQEMSAGFGLSPSHFARKFQHSTGLSLNRFINQRRIRRSLVLLKAARVPLAQLSHDLGFCSQSHFTRLFGALTGLSPHQFRRSHRHMGK
jgi:AraC-like DNA-binding protein